MSQRAASSPALSVEDPAPASLEKGVSSPELLAPAFRNRKETMRAAKLVKNPGGLLLMMFSLFDPCDTPIWLF
jgi:hypothetical protein